MLKYWLFFLSGNFGTICRHKAKILLLFVLIASGLGTGHGQNDDNNYYTVTGRVVDEYGKPFPDAGICVEPVVDNSDAFDRFIECIGTETDGRFSIKKYRNESTIGQRHFLFVSVDISPDARTFVRPPYDWLRRYDKTFNGKLVKLGAESMIDVGDVKVQFWYGQATLKFLEYGVRKRFKKIDWRHINLKIKNKGGRMVHFGTLSKDSIERYIKNDGSELSISLPEGRWKVEIIEFDTRRILAQSSYFDVKRNSHPKIIMKRKS